MPQARLSEEAYLAVTRIASETGITQQEVIERAVKLYEREQFFAGLEEDFAAVRANPQAATELDAEREEWDGTLMDGADD